MWAMVMKEKLYNLVFLMIFLKLNTKLKVQCCEPQTVFLTSATERGGCSERVGVEGVTSRNVENPLLRTIEPPASHRQPPICGSPRDLRRSRKQQPPKSGSLHWDLHLLLLELHHHPSRPCAGKDWAEALL